MSEKIPVHIYFVLDRSGSMASIASDVIGGFNQFIDDQRAQKGKCRLTMIQFDSQDPNELLYDAVKIAAVEPLTRARFQPRGGTPLLDAEGWMLNKARERETARAQAGKKAEAVLFVTYTDGMENASREWTKEALSQAKADAESRGYAFTYLGCGHDAYHQARMAGTNAAAVQNFTGDRQGVGASFQSVSALASHYRDAATRGRRTKSAGLYEVIGKGAEEDAKGRGSGDSGPRS